jgi:hypothetical protein
MVEPEMSRGGRHRNVRICREARGSRVRLSAAYDWRRIHSATPQRNALTCRDGCAYLSGEGSLTEQRHTPIAAEEGVLDAFNEGDLESSSDGLLARCRVLSRRTCSGDLHQHDSPHDGPWCLASHSRFSMCNLLSARRPTL